MAVRFELEASQHVVGVDDIGFKAVAGENLGYAEHADGFPGSPTTKGGQILRWGDPGDAEDKTKVYLMKLDKTDDYAGINEYGTKLGEEALVRIRGIVKLAVGSVAIEPGMMTISELNGGENPGDVIPFVDPALSDTPLTAVSSLNQAIVGRAIDAGVVRAGATRALVRIILRGF